MGDRVEPAHGPIIVVPVPALVLLVGPSSSGKSTFAERHFSATEVLSSDRARAMLTDDQADMGANDDAFELVHMIAGKRLSKGKLTVIDATNAEVPSRISLLRLADDHGMPAVAIVFDLPGSVLQERHQERAGRSFGPSVIRRQRAAIRRGLPSIESEGFARVWVLHTVAEVELARVIREPRRASGEPLV